MVWFITFRVTVCEISMVEISENCWVTKKIIKLCIFKGWYLANWSSKSSNSLHFLGELNKLYQMHVNILSKLWLIFCWHQQKIQKMSHFLLFNDHNLESKHDNYMNDPSFSLAFWALSVGIFHFCISKSSKFSSMGSLPPLYYVPVCKIYTFTCQILSSLVT